MDILSELPESDFYKDEQEKLLLSYRVHKLKNKPYLVFLHGYNGNSKSWAYQVWNLSNRTVLGKVCLSEILETRILT